MFILEQIVFDTLCAIKYLSDDLYESKKPTLSRVCALLLATRKKGEKNPYLVKYDLYGVYANTSHAEIQNAIDVLADKGYVYYKSDNKWFIYITENGREVLRKQKPNVDVYRYIDFKNLAPNDEYLGNYATCDLISDFLNKPVLQHLRELEGNFSKVSPYPIDMSQALRWKEKTKILHNCLKGLKSRCSNIHIIFEYAMPKTTKTRDEEACPCVRAGVLLVSREKVLVIHFRQSDKMVPESASHAQKYAICLLKHHNKAKDMTIATIVVLNSSKKHLELYDDLAVCSPDSLPKLIAGYFESSNKLVKNIEEWTGAGFTI